MSNLEATLSSCSTLRSLLVSTVHQHPERSAVSYRLESLSEPGHDDSSVWRTLSWHEVAQLVLDTVDALDRAVGAARVVAVLSDTDARYPLLELALGLSGRVLQPIYVESEASEVRRALAISCADVLVVGRSQRERTRAAELGPPLLELDQLVRLPGVDGAPHAALSADVEPFDTRRVRGRLNALPARAPEAALLYLQSTGTTGPARVIEISEAALSHAVRAVQGEASHHFPRFLSFLPTAHISERLLTLYVSLALAGHTWYGGGLCSLEADLRACRPTAFLAPPLLFENVRGGAIEKSHSNAIGRRLLSAVQSSADALLASGVTGGARRSWGAKFFGRRLKKELGLDKAQDVLSGTAPMPPELHAWCEAAGLPLRVVYGQTEVAGATTITPRSRARFGSVGAPVRDVQLRISEQGELLVRSGAAFTRYLEGMASPMQTEERAWLPTGDRAKWLGTDELVLLGRTQSLFVTARGTRVDTAQIAAQMQCTLGDTEVAFYQAPSESALSLYVAVHPAQWRPGMAAPLALIPESDARTAQLAQILDAADPERAIRRVALFSGAFAQSTGQVGPTGKPRAWRIHELCSESLRMRAATADSERPVGVGGPTRPR